MAEKQHKPTCKRCRGEVIVPTKVKWSPRLEIYTPPAECTVCGRGYRWNGETWYCDRELIAPRPEIVA